MKSFRLFSAIIVFQTATIVALMWAAPEGNVLSRKKRVAETNNSTCSTEQLKFPVAGAILKRRQEGNNSSLSSFLPGEKAEFVCKDGYRLQGGQLKSFICQEDGTWKENSPSQAGFCAKIADLTSDEVACGPTLIDVTGKATGILTSAIFNQQPFNETLNCTWTFSTKDPGFYIKLLFINFSMSSDCTDNFISLENVAFTDFSRTPECCKGQDEGEDKCRFGGKTSPPLSRSVRNSMVVKFYTKSPKKSHFKAMWYNVNGLFPNGSIPSKDSTYPPLIVLPTPKKNTPESSDMPSVLALVTFALIVFAVSFILSCKLGRRYLGPRCSFGHFRAWVSSRWTRQAPSTPRRTGGSSEARGLMTDTDSPFTGERVLIRVSDRSDSEEVTYQSSHDSSLNVA